MITGQSPQLVWRANRLGLVRTIEEAIEIARQHGVQIPDDVSFHVDEMGLLAPNQTARGPNVTKAIDEDIAWADLVHDQTGKVPFLIRPDVLRSDEAIVAVFSHELHELAGLKRIFEASGGHIPYRHFVNFVAPGVSGNLHDEAWDIADALVEQMRRSDR